MTNIIHMPNAVRDQTLKKKLTTALNEAVLDPPSGSDDLSIPFHKYGDVLRAVADMIEHDMESVKGVLSGGKGSAQSVLDHLVVNIHLHSIALAKMSINAHNIVSKLRDHLSKETLASMENAEKDPDVEKEPEESNEEG